MWNIQKLCEDTLVVKDVQIKTYNLVRINILIVNGQKSKGMNVEKYII